ncbi:MAG TPA: acyl-CoA synthetase FdrA [Xanthobacteraceae bacterium]|jgi:succinyl-CoA synthetase alpha subunit|nr:acyl-CoA synthetase FdrA [Xanthobacteraceae bacterium]
MPTFCEVIPREYRDSVALMQLSAALAKMPGVAQASAVMGTENNLSLLRQAGMDIGQVAIGPNDLLIAIQGDEAAAGEALKEAKTRLSSQGAKVDAGGPLEMPPHSIGMALARHEDANLAMISTPGEYATAEALKALNLGLNVMLFSNNVSGADEAMLKRVARDKDLIVMGPDCGTAIINGIPLAFANVVKRGPIGAVGASGTGLQEITVLVDRLGSGISQAIGTGGHDLSAEVGGISMLTGLKYLTDDPETKIITLISKPPAKEIADQILGKARASGKPVVVIFLGADPKAITGGNIHGATTLEDAARIAVALAKGEKPPAANGAATLPAGLPKLAPGQKYIRGLFSGGTFCFQATMLLQSAMDIHSNSAVGKSLPLADMFKSEGNTVVDLGDDVFTRGRPHPMIDYRLRTERIVQEAQDPGMAVLLLDVVLGFGSNADPAAELIPALKKARQIAEKEGRAFICVGHVCGTDGDHQGLAAQSKALAETGMILADSNAQAVRLARDIVAPAK